MDEITLFTDALRAAVPVRPDPEVRTLLVPRLAAVARVATLEAETQARDRRAPARVSLWPHSRRGLVARIAVVVAVVPLALAGLAFAGVTVPAPAENAFESVGVTLPNQPSDHSRKAPATTQPNPSSSVGSGNDVSSAAHTKAKGKPGNSAAAHEHARKQHKKADARAGEKAKGHGQGHGNAVEGKEASPPRHSGRTSAPARSNPERSSSSHSSTTADPHTQTPKGAATHTPKGAAKFDSKVPARTLQPTTH
jgi:hypothetical protein